MSVTHVVGIDPGLVHTGVAGLVFNPHKKQILVQHEVIAGPDAQAARSWIDSHAYIPHGLFVEKYQPRNTMSTDVRMVEAQQKFRAALQGPGMDPVFILNTGVTKVIRKPLMELLGVWTFSTVTNHQDLRSAARIALYGMVKDELMNRLLYRVISDHLAGETWDVAHH